MAQDNARTLRGILEEWDPAGDVEAWKRGRTSARVFLLDPDVVYEDGVLPDQMRETGYEGVARATQRWLEPFENVRIEWTGTSARVTAWSRSTERR